MCTRIRFLGWAPGSRVPSQAPTIGGSAATIMGAGTITNRGISVNPNQSPNDNARCLFSVAHEIRNPLTAIKAWLFLQQKHLQPGTPEHTDTDVIAGEVNRLERIVKEVLLLARPSEPHLATVPADEPLRQVQALLKPQLEKANIRLAVQDSVSSHIKIDPQQIQQVLINLIQNAADSIGHDGEVTLRARFDNKRLADRVSEVVVLEVTDTGKGIPPEVEKRLFDPFFTTKDAGTGLGLAIAARIVEKHGGALQYQTQPNRCTTFGIVLPR